MIRRDYVTDQLMWDTTLPSMQDRDFVARWVMQYSLGVVPEVLYQVHRVPGEHMSNPINTAIAIPAFREKYKKYVKAHKSVRVSLSVQEAVASFRVSQDIAGFRTRIISAIKEDPSSLRLLKWYAATLLGRKTLLMLLR